jgi:adenosylcobinamide kinase/adenosylcobinamide-phosphate guanylyltransferase
MLTLLIGGARSGKSEMAERLAHVAGRPVLFVATLEPGDDEMRRRIAQHRATRPASWRTVEAPRRLAQALREHARPGETVLVDCLTLAVSNIILERLGDMVTVEEADGAVDDCAEMAQELVSWAATYDGDVIVVTNEVGMGVVPPYLLGRVFRDALGRANATLAASADRVLLLVAGLVLDVTSAGAHPIVAFGEAPDT